MRIRKKDFVKKCGECKYNRRDWTNPDNTDFYCGNGMSENYGYNTGYSDGCEDWENKDTEDKEV